jgi:hypothetical protein
MPCFIFKLTAESYDGQSYFFSKIASWYCCIIGFDCFARHSSSDTGSDHPVRDDFSPALVQKSGRPDL